MLKLNRYVLFILLLTCCFAANAQQKVLKYAITTDIAYDAESIPMIGIERFYLRNSRLMSWHIDAEYQLHYNNEFGVIFNQGDDISIGVYQGPGIKAGISTFSKWHNRKWLNYCSYTLGIKYLWYDSLYVNTDQHSWLNPAYRQQSEKAVALVPQIYWGQKRAFGSFLFDYYFGVQLSVKFREKTIYRETDNYNVSNPDVPYTARQVSAAPDLVLGIKLGYVRKLATPAAKPEEEHDTDKKDDDIDRDEK